MTAEESLEKVRLLAEDGIAHKDCTTNVEGEVWLPTPEVTLGEILKVIYEAS